MERAGATTVTQLLLRWKAGDRDSLDRVILIVNRELRRIAHHAMRGERPGHTLQTTALVNEAYLRLVDRSVIACQDRAHFLGIAAGLMREILVDQARRRCRAKRGGGAEHLPLDEGLVYSPSMSESLLTLNEALDRLSKFDARKARVVELRFFAGMSVEEAAEVLGVHENTVIHDWNLAKAWLKRELEKERPQ
ncbi:MAG: sigma-70 family RNA polymerase sigma factor [Bryobacteraceae bacterium]